MRQAIRSNTHPVLKLTVIATASALAAGALLYAGRAATAVPETAHAAVTAPVAPAAGFADLVERVRPAVVNISIRSTQPVSTRGRGNDHGPSFKRRQGPDSRFPTDPQLEEFMRRYFGERFGDRQQGPRGHLEARSLGSGFIIDDSGLVVTSQHVIDNADEIEVILDDGRSFPVSIRGQDERTDIALLQIESTERFPYLALGDSDTARVGDWVVAIGNPFGLGGTTTSGIVSARGRNINSGPYLDYIQIDAPINRGNSGGPLFNQAGEVIGVNTAIYSPNGGSVGIGFAIPVNLVADVIGQLRDSGQVTRAWLGVRIQKVGPDIAESFGLEKPRGALVVQVTPGSPAENSGLLPGDIILAFDGKPIKRMRQLPRLVAATALSSPANLKVWRNGKTLAIVTELKPMADNQPLAAAKDAPAARLGLTLSPLDQAARQRLGADRDGVLIREVAPRSAAARKGLQAGDIILQVGRELVHSPTDVINQVQLAKERDHRSALLLIERNGLERFVAVRLS